MTDDHRISEFFDLDWEVEAARALESVGHDPSLGIDAARDALRVTSGKLSDEEFYELHHAAYLREFGVDRRSRQTSAAGPRPSASPEPDGIEQPEPRASVDEEATTQLSRSTALKWAGAGAAALLFGQAFRSSVRAGSAGGGPQASAAAASGETGVAEGVRWGMVIDLERCTGCLACVDGCHEENGLSAGVHWIYALAFSDENREAPNFLVRTCQHCSNAPCVKVCPVAARHVRESDGLVLTDYDICIGCRYCEVACPYGANYFQWGEPTNEVALPGSRRDERGRTVIGAPPRGVMGKCTFCPQRQDDPDSRGTAACALACPHDVIHIGDLNDPESAPMRHLRSRQEENPNLSTFRLFDQLGTEPNVIYIGQEPSERAAPVAGPTSYEDWGFIEDRRAVLEGPEPWFRRMIRSS